MAATPFPLSGRNFMCIYVFKMKAGRHCHPAFNGDSCYAVRGAPCDMAEIGYAKQVTAPQAKA